MTQQDENLSDIEIDENDIAIVGMSGRFPGAKNLDEFWHNLKNGVESISFLSERQLLKSGIERELLDDPNYVRVSGSISDIDLFDAKFFNYSPREAQEIDPQQRLFLECSWEAIESAGYDPENYDGSIGVYAGSGLPTYLMSHLGEKDFIVLSSKSFEQMVGNDKDYLATRVAYKLNLTGPAINVQTACSTSLVAVHLACQSILNGECDMALAGGISVQVPQEVGYLYQEGMILSPDGHCRAFDANAQGTVFGNGIGVVLLKGLEDAIADGDPIYAVVKGSAINNDGSLKLGYTAPSVEGQASVISEAQAVAGVDPSSISYVEAHGTGTKLGDPIEIEALSRVFSEDTDDKQFCAIGSVKANVGHLNTAAGVVALIKTVLSLKHKVLVPSINYDRPNPQIDFENSPFYVNTELVDWETNGEPRRAGVSSFGVGGTNSHVVLQEPPEVIVEKNKEERPRHVLALSGKTPEALRDLARNYQNYLQNNPDVNLADVCYSANTGRAQFSCKLAVSAADTKELVEKLSISPENGRGGFSSNVVFSQDSSEPAPTGPVISNSGKVAFLFTGQGSQVVDMGLELYLHSDVFRDAIAECDELLDLEPPLLDVLYPNLKQKKRGRKPKKTLLDQTSYTQPALFAVEYALAQVWLSWGIKPDIVMGHSVGEYVAAVIAGVFSLEDGLKLIEARAKLMQELPAGGGMLSAMVSETDLKPILAEYGDKVAVGALNGPQSTVISGKNKVLDAIAATLEEKGIKTKALQVSHAFHSPLMEPMLAEFETIAKELTYDTPEIPLVSNVTGKLADVTIASAQYWVDHVRQPVRFAQSMQTLHQQGYDLFLEVGPQPVLLGMGRKCLPADTGIWLPSLRSGADDWEQILDSLAELYAQGITVDWSAFDEDYYRQKVVVPTYPFQRERHWIEPFASQPSGRAGLQTIWSGNGDLGEPAPTASYPLLGHKFPLPLTEQVRFQTQFSPEFPSYTKDHRYYDKVVVAGASHIVMGWLAAQQALKSDACVLDDIEFTQILGGDDTRTVQVVLEQTAEGEYDYQLISCLAGEENNPDTTWIVHTTAKVRGLAESEREKDTLDLEAIRARCDRNLPSSDYYSAVLDPLDGQFMLGTTFQWTEEAWLGNGEGLIKLKSPATHPEMDEYWPHPGAIDAGIVPVALLSVSRETDNGDGATEPAAYAFTRADSFRILQAIDKNEELWYYTKLDEYATPDQLRGNTYLVTSSGDIVAEYIGIDFRELSRKLLLKSFGLDLDDWYYQLQWQPSESSTEATIEDSGTYAILAPNVEVGDRISAALTEKGYQTILAYPGEKYEQTDAQHYQLRPTAAEDFGQWWETINASDATIRGILHLWGLDGQPIASSNIDNKQELTCASILNLLQGVPSANELPPLWLVTQGGQAVTDDTLVAPEQSLLWGLGKVIPMEHPELQCRCIDLDPKSNSPEQDFIKELLSPTGENQVGYRDGERYALRMASARVESKPVTPTPDGSYLITGGLGALGLAIAENLVSEGAQHLILTGRSTPSESAQQTISALEETGATISVFQADISDKEHVVGLFEQIKKLPALKGVIHAAGLLDDSVLQQMTWERFSKVLAPKVSGTWYLHESTKDLDLDFFACFSSIASMLGSPGQSNYAAANGFMDAIVYTRRSQGLPGISINWGPWANIGLAARMGAQQQNRLADQGIQMIPAEQGLQALTELLGSEQTQAAVFPVNWPQFLIQMGGSNSPPILQEIAGQFDLENLGGGSGPRLREFLEQVKAASGDRRLSLILEYLTTTVAKVLRRSPKDLPDAEEGFFNLGLDSLMTIDLAQKIQNDLGISLSSTATFEYPNIQELTGYVDEVIPKIEVVEEEAEGAVSEIDTERLMQEIAQLSGEELDQSIDEALTELYALI
ncbi:type I polyketide synthase [Roseofilum casamattae]|uniref:Type I polyketide synthase n=1 Tax=Roseofilum casamattae BLCC-M143 TaxID=3022442 RepID=A0ABT7BWT3_9CYAN|nr:type I polyketide synthase [Roseofilum casamattae]MDJ1183277.1 type I polyketide synthase [Roseofilum casamattae BLCC-M143]